MKIQLNLRKEWFAAVTENAILKFNLTCDTVKIENIKGVKEYSIDFLPSQIESAILLCESIGIPLPTPCDGITTVMIPLDAVVFLKVWDAAKPSFLTKLKQFIQK